MAAMPESLRALLFLTGGATLLFATLVAAGRGLLWYCYDRPQQSDRERKRRAKGLCPC